MGICGRLFSLYRREESPEDKRGKACLANGELYTIEYTPHLRVRDVCIAIAKLLNIAPVALDFFTLMTTDCEHCLRPNRQIKQQCDKQNDHYLNPKRVLHEDEIASKVFFFRLAFKAVPGPDIKLINRGAYEYFVMQCRWDYISGRINCLQRKDHLTLLVLEAIIRAHEEGVQSKEILENPKRFGLVHLFVDNDYSVREIKNHLKRQLSQFKQAQDSEDKAKNSFLFVLESVPDFCVTKIIVKKFYYQCATEDVVYPVEWEILISANGLKKRRTYKDERDDEDDNKIGRKRVDEMISDYKDIEYLEVKQSASDEIIHISRQKGFLEVISVGKSIVKKESLITLIEGYYHLLVNQYKTLTKYEAGLELPISSTKQKRKLPIHGPIERKKVEALLKSVEMENGHRSGVHMIRRSRNEFDTFILSFICGSEIKHFEIVLTHKKYGLKNGPRFDSITQLLEFYKTEQRPFPTKLTKYCQIPKEGLCALYDDQIVVEAPCVPTTQRPANPDYQFEYIGNLQLEKLSHTFTFGDFGGERVFKARWLRDGKGGYQEVFCRRLEPSRAPDFKERVGKCGEKMAMLVHRNLVQFHGVCFYDDQNTYLTFEWIPAGTLDDYLKKETDVTVETLVTFAAQIAEACMFLHEKNYVHGWLAAHNVLVVSDEQVKLSDVSVPCLREEDMLTETVNINRSPWKARECFQGRKYSKESDVWAFGVVLWEMFMKTKPFQNMTDDMILQVFQQDRHLAPPKWCPEEVGKIMKSCWLTEPSQRPSFANIIVKLRQIMFKLSRQERERTIPETIDEKFAIEPLLINKPSPTAPNENLPQTLSCNYDNSDGTLKDTWSNEGSCLTVDDLRLDLIPEKESPEMVWSPEEIEMKTLNRTYPRPTVPMEKPTDAMYDRIVLDSLFETNEETLLLPSHDENVAVKESETIISEIQTAVDNPTKQQEHLAEDIPPTTDSIRSTTKDFPDEHLREYGHQPGRDNIDVQPTYDRLPEDTTENVPADDEEIPLITNTGLSLAQTDSMGFLASQLGCEGAMTNVRGYMLTDEDNDDTSVDNDDTLLENDNTVEADSGVSNQESTGMPEGFLAGNLDPFADVDGINKMFSKLNSIPKKSENVVFDEGKYVSNTRYACNLGSVDPVKQSPSSPFIMAGSRFSMDPSGSGRPRNNGYVKTPSCSRTNAQTMPSRPNTNYLTGHSSLKGMVEFSKLDPFAMSSPSSNGSELNSTRVAPSEKLHTAECLRHVVKPDDDLFSSFLNRDPMSELSTNNMPLNSEALVSKSIFKNEQEKHITCSSSNMKQISNPYISHYSLGSASRVPKKINQFPIDYSGSTYVTPETLQNSVQTQNSRTNRGGYVSMPNHPQPITSQGERDFTNQKGNPNSYGRSGMSLENFSERDPFSEAATNENKMGLLHGVNNSSGNSPQPGINLHAGMSFLPGASSLPGVRLSGRKLSESLSSKSREARSMEYTTPGMMITPDFVAPVIRPPGLVPSKSYGASVAKSSTLNHSSSLPTAFKPSSVGKPSLGNLALKLSEARQSAAKAALPKHANSEGFKPSTPTSVRQSTGTKIIASTYSSLNAVQNPYKGRNTVLTSSKKSGYVTVSPRSKNPEKVKTSKVRAVDESVSHDAIGILSNRDVFSDILQVTPTETSGASSLSVPLAANMDPFANRKFGGVKLYTEAESDKDPYHITSKLSAQCGNMRESDKDPYHITPKSTVLSSTVEGSSVLTSGRITKQEKTSEVSRSSSLGTKEQIGYSTHFKTEQSPSRKKQPKSNYQPVRDGASKNIIEHSPSEATPKDSSEKSRTKPSEQGVGKFDISQLFLEDLLGSMALQGMREGSEAQTSEKIDESEKTNSNTTMSAIISEETSSNETTVSNEVHSRLDVDNIEPEAIELSFNNRDPFAELSSAQHDLNRKSLKELVSSQGHGSDAAPSGSAHRKKAVLVTSYSNTETREQMENLQPNRTKEGPPKSPGNSSGSPPGNNNGQNPPPLKPKAKRKVSDIGIEYAQVSIRRTQESTSYEEPVLGAASGSEPGSEVPARDLPAEPVYDGRNDTTVVDPFNMSVAEESIQNLDPSYPRSRSESGKNVSETFEESMKSHYIAFENLAFNDQEPVLGRGAFGVVRKAKLTRISPAHHTSRSTTEVAVKCCKDDASEIYKNSFKQEAINLMKLDNKFIVRFLGVSYNEEKNLLLITELVPQGSLDKYLREPSNLKILGNEVLLQFAIQITMGMEYLESKKLVHRDLAARNILVAAESHVKISDFGLSRIYDDEYYRSHRENAKLPIRWLAPECLEQKKFTVYSDVWSLGVTLWEMFSYGKRPYEDCNFSTATELIQFLKAGKQLSKPAACPEEIYTYVQECWRLTPLKRISFFLLKTFLEEILKDKYQKRPYFI